MIMTAVLALGGAALTLPDRLPLYCYDSSYVFQPVQQTDLGRLKTAFRQQFAFSSAMASTSDNTAVLTFRGGKANAETITFDVGAYQDGVALFAMHVRLKGAREDLIGTDMCWRTFSIVNSN